MITFIIPVRHQKNASNWSKVKANLTDTIRSISSQDHPGWKAIIVANRGADLPVIPTGFDVIFVDFPPNPLFKIGGAPIAEVYEAVCLDKGRRVLVGLLAAGQFGHVMVVDDDDFVSSKIASFLAKRPDAYGFYIRDGYIWGDGGSLLFKYDGDFSELCGTSHIVRADLFGVPQSFDLADDHYIKTMLGSHKFIRDRLRENSTPLEALPFYGAVYRVGHSENHSQARSMLSTYFLQRWLWRSPLRQLKRLSRLRLLNARIAREFFGAR